MNPETRRRAMIRTSLVIACVAAFALTFAQNAVAASKPIVYKTPEAATNAFIAAVRKGDVKKLVRIFGSDSDRLFASTDKVADKNVRKMFLALYDEKHELTSRDDGSKILVVGNNAWPYPVPLVKSGNGWVFDTPTGFDEIINRRVGRDELETIQTCLAIADAQREYYAEDRNGDGILEYAQKFRSTKGQEDGLYWPVKEGQPLSPLGDLVASAADEGYTAASSAYHGYHYKLLTAQGPNAQGGAYDYMVRSNQIGGFAVLAYPADYGDSGVMTFMVSHSGIIYQKDLGPNTKEIASKITTFDPGEGWQPVGENDLQPLPAD